MKKSFLGSVSIHALVLLAALFGVQSAKPFELKPVEAIQVDISNITDKTEVKAQTKSDEPPAEKPKPKASQAKETTKPQEKVAEVKKTARVEEEQKPKPEPEETAPEPKPKPKPEPKPPEKKVEDKPVDSDPLKDMIEAEEAELKKAEEKKKKEDEKKQKEAEKKKAEEEKKKEEAAAAAAEKKKKAAEEKKKAAAEKERQKQMEQLTKDLLADTSVTESQSTVKQEEDSGAPEKAEKDIQGKDAAMSATIVDALRQKLSECWNIPPSVRESKETVQLTWQMSRDGRLLGQPVVIGGSGGATAQQAAITAVSDCAPYDWLPAEGYDLWKEVRWTFKPR
jgi:TolA protein